MIAAMEKQQFRPEDQDDMLALATWQQALYLRTKAHDAMDLPGSISALAVQGSPGVSLCPPRI
ncbi:hypothetical protein JZ751_014955, partial [Albula glossodonta]